MVPVPEHFFFGIFFVRFFRMMVKSPIQGATGAAAVVAHPEVADTGAADTVAVAMTSTILTNLHNVFFSLLDLDELFLDSPLQQWYQGKRWLINEEHQSAFISDASRAEILRKYGGTYMDMDALTLRPLPNRTNYLGRLDNQIITGAIMSLVKGHPLSQCVGQDDEKAKVA
ncbi:lactosylceramide 4-alpha-galactosyltransferase-like [Macrobrachium nipponense]|uniref:lactosylceramide 4-alpha-galactosyltransferase-like n=1 Tax=Macrobrachium nipponense TaxID=159736 RepID=UPI0030C8AEBE